jgi:hypothetical protein
LNTAGSGGETEESPPPGAQLAAGVRPCVPVRGAVAHAAHRSLLIKIFCNYGFCRCQSGCAPLAQISLEATPNQIHELLKIAKLPWKRSDLISLATSRLVEKKVNFSLHPSLTSPSRTVATVPRSGLPAGVRDRHGTATREHLHKLHALIDRITAPDAGRSPSGGGPDSDATGGRQSRPRADVSPPDKPPGGARGRARPAPSGRASRRGLLPTVRPGADAWPHGAWSGERGGRRRWAGAVGPGTGMCVRPVP